MQFHAKIKSVRLDTAGTITRYQTRCESALLKVAQRAVDLARGSMREGLGIPSTPGKPPHIQTGALRDSMKAVHARGIRVEMLFYGWIHEFGGRLHPPRPFMWPQIRKQAKEWARLARWGGATGNAAQPTSAMVTHQIVNQGRNWLGQFNGAMHSVHTGLKRIMR